MLILEDNALNLQEYYKRYKPGMAFAIATAISGSNSDTDNKSLNRVFRSKVSQAGYEMLVVKGHYKQDNRYYEAMIIWCPDDKQDEFIRFLLFYGKKYTQDFFVFVDNNNIVWRYAASETSTLGSYGFKKRYDKFIYNHIEELINSLAERTYTTDKVTIKVN